MFRKTIFLMAVVLSGCITTQNKEALRIENVDKRLQFIQEVVVSILPLGQRAISPNAREFLSKYFVPKKAEYAEADTAPRRWFAHIFVLGDRRPYNIEILVKRERRVVERGTLSYAPEGLDLRIASDLKKKLQEELTKRREDTNIIDDFKVF